VLRQADECAGEVAASAAVVAEHRARIASAQAALMERAAELAHG
jgi:hypothetical protein